MYVLIIWKQFFSRTWFWLTPCLVKILHCSCTVSYNLCYVYTYTVNFALLRVIPVTVFLNSLIIYYCCHCDTVWTVEPFCMQTLFFVKYLFVQCFLQFSLLFVFYTSFAFYINTELHIETHLLTKICVKNL